MSRTTDARGEATEDGWTVGQVAERFGITVRTLHHYDEVGLLTPSARTYAGYRLYTAADLERLQAVVGYRRLGFSLAEVAQLVATGGRPGAEPAAGGTDLVGHLRRQRDLVTTQLGELNQLAEALDHALEAAMNDRPATDAELRELFGEGFDDTQQEAQERWGDTDAYRESRRRTTRYTPADWAEVKAEADAVERAFLAAKRAGMPPTSPEAMDAAEAHRRHIDDRFYPVSYEMHRGLADMYVADARFTAHYDEGHDEPGLAAYVREAIHANADRHGG